MRPTKLWKSSGLLAPHSAGSYFSNPAGLKK